MPMMIRDYTDFYSSFNHAYNIGVMVRGHDNAIQPNWRHLPVGYHGRASSIVIDGTPIRRPKGQVSADKVNPSWSACQRMDFELELGTLIAHGNELGNPIKVENARDHIFGYVLLNDWSARDLQVWEYVPLGPFNAKNFGSTISPWVITPEALEPFKVALPKQEPELLSYLQDKDLSCYDVDLKVKIKTPKMDSYHEIANSNLKYLYYSVAQTITHHTVTGCNMGTGDMLGSGTISGPEKHERGSMMELSWGGKEPLTLPSGEERKFLHDGDSLLLEGVAKGNGYQIGFGQCEGTILPAHDDSHFF
jgi:fumarylacetoacetase